MGKFEDQINKFARKYEARLKLIAQISVQDTVSMAQKTRPEGGRMLIDTGFLRASVQAGVGQMPSGPTRGKKGAKKGEYAIGTQVTGEPVSVTLLRWDPNKSIPVFIGWTANYARHREAQDGFLRGAVEKWDQIVFKAVKKVEIGFG